jgi:hypothetical protein
MSENCPDGVNHLPLAGLNPWAEGTPIEGEVLLEQIVPTANSDLLDPADSLQHRVASRLGDTRLVAIAKALKTDITGSEHKTRTISSGIAALGVMGVGAARLPFVLVPHIAIDVLHGTNSAVDAGMATATAFSAWSFTVGQVINNGMSQYPATTKAIGDNFSSSVNHFSHSLPGLEAYSEEKDNDPRRSSLAHAVGSTLLTHTRRGLTAFSLGIIPYVGTAGITGQSKSAIRKLSAALSIDGGLLVGGMFGGVTEAIITASHTHPEGTQQLQNIIGDTKVWYGVAAGLMVGEWLNNKRKGRRKSAQNKES